MQRKLLFISISTLVAALNLPAMASPRVHRGPTSPRINREHTTQARPKSVSGISPERASAIQDALVKAGYLKETSGIWDAGTQTAMEKLQADNGWQVKLVPDARALIKLGLGPGSDPDSSASVPVFQ